MPQRTGKNTNPGRHLVGKEDELVYNIEDITSDLEEWDKDKMNDYPQTCMVIPYMKAL